MMEDQAEGKTEREHERAPVAVVMISRNEAHNMRAVLDNIGGWAREIFLVDSYSDDETVDIALEYGVHVVQRRFRGFGDQWNFALSNLPITSPWTMKMDPDERLSSELKEAIRAEIERGRAEGMMVTRRLRFMGHRLPIKQRLLRVWRTGRCRFSNVPVNEHPLVEGRVAEISGEMDHHDSPNLHHWLEKQNAYTTAEAAAAFEGHPLAVSPALLRGPLARRMWIKAHFNKIPGRFVGVFLYYFLLRGAWKAGRVGFIWARLRADVYRMRFYKLIEMQRTGRAYAISAPQLGEPHPGATEAQ